MIVQETSCCRICGQNDLQRLLDLGSQALSGRFPASRTEAIPQGPLLLVRCANCGLVQLAHDFDMGELYSHDYGYRSGINEIMRQHLAGIVAKIESLVDLRPDDVVLDIAANDGTLLGSYSKPVRKIGIDPIIEGLSQYYSPDVTRVPAFFTAKSFKDANVGPKAKVISSIAMFYDLPRPHDFVADIAEILAADGIWVLEQAHLGLTLEHCAFDSICHEHLEYYAFAQIDLLTKAHGLRIFAAETNDCNGGSFRLYVCHKGAAYKTDQASIDALIAMEERQGVNDLTAFANMQKRMEALRTNLISFFKEQKSKGKLVHAYGASTKGNVLLQYCGLNSELIAAAADRNPTKWGKFTPANYIPIISEEESRKQKPDFYLVLPWHFRKGFIVREKAYVDQGGKFIFPLPEFEVYPE